MIDIRKTSYRDYFGITRESYEVYYINKLYKNSPFKCPQTFSTEFTLEEILNSPEISRFLERFK